MQKTLLNNWKIFKFFILENKVKFMNIIFYFILLLIVYFIISKIIKKFIKISVKLGTLKNKEDLQKERITTLSSVIDSILKVLVFVILVAFILKEFEIKLIPFITGLGFLGVAIIAIFQNTIQDIIKGWIILFEDQARRGEWITINNIFTGKVVKINLRYLILKDNEGNLIFFPNSQISSIINLSRENKKFYINIKINKDQNLDEILQKLNEDIIKFKEKNPQIIKIWIDNNINITQAYYEVLIFLTTNYLLGKELIGELKKHIFSKYKEYILEIL